MSNALPPEPPVFAQPPLTPQERSALRARAHPLKPVVMISTKGASTAVIAEIDRALTHHELIKIRVLEAERGEREALLESVCAATGAQPVQHIGKVLVIYRLTPKVAAPEARSGISTAADDARRSGSRRVRSTLKQPASRTPRGARPTRAAGSRPGRFVSEERRRTQRRRPAR